MRSLLAAAAAYVGRGSGIELGARRGQRARETRHCGNADVREGREAVRLVHRWVQHMVKSMAARTGRMAVVLPQGALFRGGVEGQIRKHLLEHDLVEAVIGLAPNLFYGTGLAACVLVLRQKKATSRKGKVLVVDASSLFRKGRAQNFMEPTHGAQILAWTQAFEDVEDRARVVSIAEIEKEGWTLNISRYVLPPIGADIPPLHEAVAAFKEALSKCREAEDELRRVMHEGGWLQ
jgi:type I restriction enzyme M protein